MSRPTRQKKVSAGGNALQSRKVRDNIAAYLFLAPALIGFIMFIGGPILVSLGLVFIDYNLIQPPTFIGLENLQKFFSDKNIGTVFGNTLKFLLILPPIHCFGGLILA
ncbi:MAG: sugar ABC transporter permease, partial [Oscillospiraceae bacterium]